MKLSVVIPTLNGRQRLAACLDAVATHLPETEVLVVNGPSVDGTTGMIKERSDVDVLLETPTRNPTVARNAGIRAATGDTIAFLRHDRLVDAGWIDGLNTALGNGVDAVTGPTRGKDSPEPVNQENVAIRREILETVDGFDEYLTDAGVADLWLRVQAAGYETAYDDRFTVTQAYGTDGGETGAGQRHSAQAVGYLIGKNGPLSVRRVTSPAVRSVFGRPQALPRKAHAFGIGLKDGVAARRSGGRGGNPNGVSTTNNRSIKQFDWR